LLYLVELLSLPSLEELNGRSLGDRAVSFGSIVFGNLGRVEPATHDDASSDLEVFGSDATVQSAQHAFRPKKLWVVFAAANGSNLSVVKLDSVPVSRRHDGHVLLLFLQMFLADTSDVVQ
jgi:hypothetical protein